MQSPDQTQQNSWPAGGRSNVALAPLDIARWLFLLGMLTASCDIFLAMRVGGFTLRANQILLTIPLAYTMGLVFSDRKMRGPVGGIALLIWTYFILAFIPNTTVILRSVGYAVWLLLDIIVVVVAVQLFDSIKWMVVLLRWYLVAYFLISIVGLAQFVLGVMHLPAPFVTQWLIPGVWPRLNGFSYEPSYYSTYLIMGWVFSAYLLEKGNDLLPAKLVRASFLAATLALILSLSRLGWAAMGLWGFVYFLRRFGKFAAPRFKLATWLVVFNIAALGTAALVGFSIHESNKVLQFFAGGTGLFRTPAHSVTARQTHLAETLDLVWKSPFIGYSLGGVASAIGEEKGATITSQEGAKQHEGSTVFAEVLAASGVIGFIPFVAYILMLFVKPARLASAAEEPFRTILVGLLWALGFEFLMLQFNQNILRPYLWFHIAVLSAAYVAIGDHVRRKKPATRA